MADAIVEYGAECGATFSCDFLIRVLPDLSISTLQCTGSERSELEVASERQRLMTVYVLKDSTDQQVVDAARALLEGDCWIHPRIQRIVRRTESGATGLTDAKFEVLVHVAPGYIDRAIARRLYITEKAVQARLKCLYTKLGIPIKGATDEEDEFNHRCRVLNMSFRRGLINRAELKE